MKLLNNKLKPTIIFSSEAWEKIKTLVHKSNYEIGWHGVVHKCNNFYKVTDILVYPQITTAVTTEADEDKYRIWLENLSDQTYNNIRLQGHSHVNMHSSPSTTDLNYYKQLINKIKDYYIVMITNKQNDLWINLYDLQEGIIYETDDIKIIYKGIFDQWYDQITDEYVQLYQPMKGDYDYEHREIQYPIKAWKNKG